MAARAAARSPTTFSAKSKKSLSAVGKYKATETNVRWDHFAKSPPTRIGFGTLCFLANEANPNWREAYDHGLAALSTNWRIALPRVNFSNWDNEPTPEQEWAVPDASQSERQLSAAAKALWAKAS